MEDKKTKVLITMLHSLEQSVTEQRQKLEDSLNNNFLYIPWLNPRRIEDINLLSKETNEDIIATLEELEHED